MAFLMVLLFGGASYGQEEITYTVSSKTSVIADKDIDGVSATFNNTYSIKDQLTKGNSMTLTVKGYPYEVVQVKLNLRRNKSTGDGTLNVQVGDVKALNKTLTTNDLTNTYAIYSYDLSTSGIIGKDIVIKLSATNNSLYCNSFTIVPVKVSKKETTLSFGETYDNQTITKKVNDTYTAKASLKATESGEAIDGATITYESSDKEVADVEDGEVLCYKEGTAVITAKYAGDDTYAASSASYTINVVDGRTETSLTFPKTSYSFEQGADKGTETIEDNAAILSPIVGGSAIKYTSTGTDGLVEVLEDGSVIVNTNVIGSATITATFAGNDTYKPATASYTIQVYKPVSSIILNSISKSFADIEGGGSGYKTKECTFVSTEGDKYQFSVKDGMIQNDHLQLKATSGKVTSPTFGMENGYFVTVKYTSSTDMSLVINGVKTIGKNGVVAAKATSDVPFVLQTGNKYSTVSEISISTKYEFLTTAASGFATYAADFAVDYKSAGLEAYAIKVNADNSGVEYTECTGVVPAGKAVLVKGTPSTEYTLIPATEEAGEFDTDLKASDGNVTITADNHDKIYAFGTNNGKSGFKHVKVGATIAAKKGYLELNDATNAKDFFAFDNTITGIDDSIVIDGVEVPLLNLAGQHVTANYKGIVIKNGKKFVNK